MSERVKTVWAWYKKQNTLIQSLIFAAVSGLLNAGLLSFSVEYATYSFSIQKGFRPPLEGIPYLEEAVFIIALTLWVFGFLFLQCLRVALPTFMLAVSNYFLVTLERAKWGRELARKFFERSLDPPASENKNKNKNKNKKSVLIDLLEGEISDPVEVWKRIDLRAYIPAVSVLYVLAIMTILFIVPHDGQEVRGILIATGVLTIMIMHSIFEKKREMFAFIPIVLVAAIILVAPFLFFIPSVLSASLFYLGYGGDRVVTLQHVSGGLVNKCLLLRTETSVFVTDLDSDDVTEFVISDVMSLTYLNPRKPCPRY